MKLPRDLNLLLCHQGSLSHIHSTAWIAKATTGVTRSRFIQDR